MVRLPAARSPILSVGDDDDDDEVVGQRYVFNNLSGTSFGFAVRNDQGRSPLHGSPNDYYWGGAWGTYFWHDPREHLHVVFMMQSPAARLQYRYLMRELVYQALIGN